MATKTIHILQWNCRGLRSNFDELQLLIHQYNPVALCLQETMLGDKALAIKHFSFYYCPGSEMNGNHSGGVGILVNNITPHNQLRLRTSLQAIAIQVSVPKGFDYLHHSGDHVWARDYRNQGKWLDGTILQKTGPLSYRVQVGSKVWRRHIDQQLITRMEEDQSEPE
jgi:exonuclease III